jgi:hypothetical protein
MKFSCINIHNVNELVPSWAIDPLSLARQLGQMFSSGSGLELMPKGDAVYRPLGFWIEVDATASPQTVRVCTPDESVNLNGHLVIKCSSLAHPHAQIDLPLNPIFKGYERIAGSYSVYLHSFQTETPLGYVGMTKQRWFDRYSQHLSSAKAGSHLLFHQALRKHLDVTVMHKVFMCELSHDAALQYEEEWVAMFGLYPIGLNMIPGGLAGFKYLASLGLQAKSVEDRDVLLEQVAARESIEGRPNPLCAARWATDEAFVERVICGHSGRLTAEQVRQIRLGAAFGRSPEELMAGVSARNLRQVRNVLSNKTYSRIRSGG